MVPNPYGKKPLFPSIELDMVLSKIQIMASRELLFSILNYPECLSEPTLRAMQSNFSDCYPEKALIADNYSNEVRTLRYTLNILN